MSFGEAGHTEAQIYHAPVANPWYYRSLSTAFFQLTLIDTSDNLSEEYEYPTKLVLYVFSSRDACIVLLVIHNLTEAVRTRILLPCLSQVVRTWDQTRNPRIRVQAL